MKFTTKQLSYEDILQYVSEEDIALYYLGVTSKSKMFSFYREETNPGKYLYYKGGRLYYNDFLESRSLPYLIMELNNWSYKQFIDHLKQDLLNQVVSTTKRKKPLKKPVEDKKTIIRIKAREWQDWDIKDFWGKGGITLNWLKDPRRNIKPLEYFWINDYLNVAEKYSYCYDYYYHANLMRRKIYQPYSANRKWVSNIDSTVLQNVNTLNKSLDNELLIISSSYKDTGVIECNLTLPDSRLYIPSVAPNNEAATLPSQIPYKFNQRFKRIVTWFDQDLAGHKAATKYETMYEYKPIFIPEYFKKNYNIKDPFEYRSMFGEGDFIRLSNYLLYENI